MGRGIFWVGWSASRTTLLAASCAFGCSRAPAHSNAAPHPALEPRGAAPAAARAQAPAASAPAAPANDSSGVSGAPPDAAASNFSFAGGEHAVAGERGIVVAVEEQAARVGVRVLESGGNAVDAAIATLLALGVTHPSAASLGGGGFALVRAAGGPTRAFDFRETAPAGLTRSRFERMLARGADGPLAVGVPGIARGIALLHATFGTRPFAELVRPARLLAEKGSQVGVWEASLIAASARKLERDAPARSLFLPHGKPVPASPPFKQPALAWTLERIERVGVDDFYAGDIARRLVRALAPEGPTLEDLTAYRALERVPLSIDYRGLTLETMPPPSAGGVALIGTLLALEASARAPLNIEAPTSLHLLLEAERRAQAERQFGVVDPDSLANDLLGERVATWKDPRFWLKIPIDPARATPSERVHTPAAGGNESEHTTQLSVVDANGMAVSLTATLSASFGAKIVGAGTGIVLNNSLASFTLSGENLPLPRRRTTSSMAPTLLLANGRTLAVLGTPGGDTIPSTLAELVVRLVDEHMPLDRAVEALRWHQSLLPDEARYEARLAPSKDLLAALGAQGHALRALHGRVGDANCIVLEGGRALGYADSREPGVALAAGK